MSNWYDITPEDQKKIDKKKIWLDQLKEKNRLKINELKNP
tara:strand:- start:542 stop:661 length:120 start_codon:yes stop_codon:yes gene_type:complete